MSTALRLFGPLGLLTLARARSPIASQVCLGQHAF